LHLSLVSVRTPLARLSTLASLFRFSNERSSPPLHRLTRLRSPWTKLLSNTRLQSRSSRTARVVSPAHPMTNVCASTFAQHLTPRQTLVCWGSRSSAPGEGLALRRTRVRIVTAQSACRVSTASSLSAQPVAAPPASLQRPPQRATVCGHAGSVGRRTQPNLPLPETTPVPLRARPSIPKRGAPASVLRILAKISLAPASSCSLPSLRASFCLLLISAAA
jgi:hypothetical protein